MAEQLPTPEEFGHKHPDCTYNAYRIEQGLGPYWFCNKCGFLAKIPVNRG